MKYFHARFALIFITATSAVYADDSAIAPDWNFSGTITNRYDYYGQSGNAANSLFPSDGGQFYSEANLNFYRRISAYERLSGNLFGVFNDSDYRSNNEDLFLERGQITWEKGDAWVPFRTQVGDFFGFFSPRTIQRTLKGAQVEFQPTFADGLRSSVLLFSGLTDATYRDLNDNESVFSGASLLLGSDTAGDYTLNVVHNRDKSVATAQPQEQMVSSVSGEHRFRVFQQELSVEGELGFFDGDHSPGSTPVEDVSDTGTFLRISGRDTSPFRYALSLERYGENYRPKGGVIAPDRSSADLNLSYRFDSGLSARFRSQRFEDALESNNATVSYVNGLNLSGRLTNPYIDNLSLFFDTFVQRSQNEDGTTNTQSFQSNLNLAAPLNKQWTGNVGLLYRTLEDSANQSDTWTGELRGSVDRRLSLGQFSGRISPGLVLRRVENDSASGVNSTDIGPSFALNLATSKHNLNFNYQVLLQNRDNGNADIVTHNTGMAYTYRTGRHQFGVDALYNSSEPDPGSNTDSYRVGGFYTFSFDRPAQQPRTKAVQPAAAFNDPLGVVVQFGSGSSLVLTRETLTEVGVAPGVSAPGSIVYDARVIDKIDQRQRLVVLNRAGLVDKIAVLIDFDDIGRPDSAARIFERVREELIRRLGAPRTSFARGEFGPDFAADVAAGRFTRVDEWDTARGVLRLGIPQRLDGQVRIEIQQAKRFPTPQRTLWSIEQVR